jgi:hypothetical protein
MSSSVGSDSTLFLTDSEEVLKAKILKHSFSGGGGNGTLEDHKKFGGNPDVDVAYQYLRYFEHDDEKLKEIHDGFVKGDITCGEIKNLLVTKLSKIYEQIREDRSKVTQEILDDFYKWKPMELPKPKEKPKEESEIKLYSLFDELKINYTTKYHALVSTAEQADNLAKSLEGSVCKAVLFKGPKDAYYLYVINNNTNINVKTLHKRMEVSKVSFGQRDTFTQIMKVPVTCPSLFGIINDTSKTIATIFVEEGIKREEPVNFNSLRPDATSTISYDDMIRFIEHHKYPIKYIKE